MKPINPVIEQIYNRVRDKINPSLREITELMSRLQNPQHRYPTLHVVGTNGKGSTARLLSALLEHEGLNTGLYTSPHLVSPFERMMINSAPITEQRFMEVFRSIASHADDLSATFFEVFTAVAFLWMAEEQVDIAVVEAGLGGTWDTTRTTLPEVVGLTTVQYDHMSRLGSDLHAIARDKAGAIQPGKPFVCGETNPELRELLAQIAHQQNAPIHFADELIRVLEVRYLSAGMQVRYQIAGKPAAEGQVTVALRGQHQVQNLRMALAMYYVLRHQLPAESDLNLGRYRWPGRLDEVSREPLVVVDVAHNTDAARVLFQEVARCYPGKRFVVLFGIMQDKNWEEYLQVIRDSGSHLVPLDLRLERSVDPQDLDRSIASLFSDVPATAAAEAAWPRAMQLLDQADGLLVCGSFHMAEIAYEQLQREPVFLEPVT